MINTSSVGSFRKPIASIHQSDPHWGINVKVLEGEYLTVSAKLTPNHRLFAFDVNHNYGHLGMIIAPTGSFIITNQTLVNIRPWRGSITINPHPPNGPLRDIHNLQIEDDYQKIGVNDDAPDEIIIELKISR